jgi:hypothetical protein
VNQPRIVIRSRRGLLLVQAAAVALLGSLAGVGLQSWSVLSTSGLGRLGHTLGLPLVAIVVAGLSTLLAIVWARDSWQHRIVLEPNQMTVRDAAGQYVLAYGDIAQIRQVPLRGVAVTLRDPSAWLARLADKRAPRERAATVLRRAYDADILIKDRELDVGASAFLELVKARMGQGASGGA